MEIFHFYSYRLGVYEIDVDDIDVEAKEEDKDDEEENDDNEEPPNMWWMKDDS
jgi:hypothetical protein